MGHRLLWAARTFSYTTATHIGNRTSRITLCGRSVPLTGDDSSPSRATCVLCINVHNSLMANPLYRAQAYLDGGYIGVEVSQ